MVAIVSLLLHNNQQIVVKVLFKSNMEVKMNTIGIDFGTSNSLAAIIQNGKVELVEFDGFKSTPTVLFFPAISLLRKSKRTYQFGRKAIQEKFEEDEIGRLVFSFKGLLADESFDGTVIPLYGTFTAETFCTYFLKKVKEQAETQFGMEFDSVVLGKPVDFDSLATDHLRTAAIEAGFSNVRFQLEPIAAAMSYESQLIETDGEQIVFVCDIGGGTSDFAIVRLSSSKTSGENRENDILATGGLYKAGDAFNSLITLNSLAKRFGKGATWGEDNHPFPAHWVNALANWKTLPFLRQENVGSLIVHTENDRKEDVQRFATLVSDNYGYQLYNSVDRAKIELTSMEKTIITQRYLNLDEPISRVQFDNFISSVLDEMEKEIFHTLRKAKLTPDQIDNVILTGGSSLVPSVHNTFADIFNESKLIPIDTFNSVVAGLALEAQKV